MSIPQIKGFDKWHRVKMAAMQGALMLADAAMQLEDVTEAARLLKRAGRMQMCSNAIIITRNTTTGERHIERAALCRDRLCPVCSWRLAMRRQYEMSKTIEYLLKAQPDIRGIMLTLTVRNCDKADVGATVRHLCESYTRIRKHKAWRQYIRGSARSIELTYNTETEQYHPHIHALLIVGPDYRAHTITQGEYADMWQTAARLDYRPIVDVRYTYTKAGPDRVAAPAEAVIAEDKLEAMSNGIIEATKYALKPSALQALLSDADAASLAKQLRGHRLIAYGGCIKAARAACGFTDRDEPNDHIPVLSAPNPQAGDLQRLAYYWSSGAGTWQLVGEVKSDSDEENHLYPSFPRKRSRRKPDTGTTGQGQNE